MSNLSVPVADLIARLTYHTADVVGRLLRGYKLAVAPIKEIQGATDLPCVRVLMPTVTEEYRGLTVVAPTLRLQIHVATLRSAGVPAFLDAVEKVQDALERDTTGAYNFVVAGTRNRIATQLATSSALDLSLNGLITVTVEPKLRERGKRSL